MDFKTADTIKLQPKDTAYNAEFKFPAATGTSTNDGAIPYDTIIDSIVVTGIYNDTTVTELISGIPTVSGTDTVQVSLNYPTTTMDELSRNTNMSLEFVLTLDDNSTKEFNYDNIKVIK